MRYRKLGTTELEVSEVGFGVRSVSTDWKMIIREDAGIALLRKAFDVGVSLFDTADSDRNGYGEKTLAKALGKDRHATVICTKFGYDFYDNVSAMGDKERPHQNFSPAFIRFACEQSLRRLNTDYIDLYQFHNPGIDVIERDDIFDALSDLVSEGKIRYFGVALGPGIGWFEEGKTSMRDRDVAAVQTVYNMLEQYPAVRFFPIAKEKGTGLLTTLPHAWGLLEETHTRRGSSGQLDARIFPSEEWLERGLKKLSRLDFLVREMEPTIGQVAIKFALSAPQVATVITDVTNQDQLEEFAAAPESEEIPAEFLNTIIELYEEDIYSEEGSEDSWIE